MGGGGTFPEIQRVGGGFEDYQSAGLQVQDESGG